MYRVYSQKEIFDYLKANPLNAKVHVGDIDNMNGKDYIFLDYINERPVGFDNSGVYKTSVQISVYVKDFINRKALVDYIKKLSIFDVNFDDSAEGNYFVADMVTDLFIV